MQRPWEVPRAECVDDDVTRLSREQQRKRLVTVPIASWEPSRQVQARAKSSPRVGNPPKDVIQQLIGVP